MKNVNPPKQYISSQNYNEAYAELIREACVKGSSQIGGYAIPIKTKHEYIRRSGKDPTNTIDKLKTMDYDAIIISDSGDLDGVASTALYKYQFENPAVFYADHRKENPISIINRIKEIDTTTPLFITDHQPLPSDEWNFALSDFESVHIRDHHPFVNGLDTSIDYSHTTNKSATEIVLTEDISNPPGHITQLAEATSIRDLWKTEHPSFEKYSLLDIAADVCVREILSTKLSQLGTGLLTDEQFFNAFTKINYERWLRVDWLLGQEEYQDHRTINEIDLTVIYGHAPDTSLLCHQTMEHFNSDIVLNVMPFRSDDNKYTISLRSTEEYPIAGKIAQVFNGGGHNTASGGRVSIKNTQRTARVHEAAGANENFYILLCHTI